MFSSMTKQFLIVFFSFLLVFLSMQSSSIYGGDAGDMVTSAITASTAHPPGYPLYSFVGWLVSFLPLNTPAWRVGLLSSIPAAAALACAWLLIYKLTSSRWASSLAVLMLGLSYVFWLYAIVPEVFALLTLFITALMLMALEYNRQPRRRLLLGIAFLAGLSLTHHHIIVFIFPTLFLYIAGNREGRSLLTIKHLATGFLLALAGLVPYAWAMIAAHNKAPLVWSNPVNLAGLFRLITRADYGSFQSGTVYGEHIGSRLLQLVALGDYYLQDFTPLGVALALVGFVGLYKKSRMDFWPLFVGFVLTGPTYFFYASYLYSTRFHIATAERFVLPSYVLLTIAIGYGIYTLVSLIQRLPVRPLMRKTITYVVYGTVLLIPMSLAFINYPKISILRSDTTAEKFGYDILRSLEPESVLMLQGDHPVFNTQYVYYAFGYRKDAQLIHMTKLLNRTGIAQLTSQYPRLIISKKHDPAASLVADIEANYTRFPIYSNVPLRFIPEGYRWVPYGLLFRLYKEPEVPPYPDIKARTEQVWKAYQDPMKGSLGTYPNLMLSNIADYYRDAHVRRGLYAAEHGKDYQNAYLYYTHALTLDPTSGTIRYLMGDAQAAQGSCTKALNLYKKGYSFRTDDPALYYDSLIDLYTTCFKNPREASIWQKKKDALSQKQERQLQEL